MIMLFFVLGPLFSRLFSMLPNKMHEKQLHFAKNMREIAGVVSQCYLDRTFTYGYFDQVTLTVRISLLQFGCINHAISSGR